VGALAKMKFMVEISLSEKPTAYNMMYNLVNEIIDQRKLTHQSYKRERVIEILEKEYNIILTQDRYIMYKYTVEFESEEKFIYYMLKYS